MSKVKITLAYGRDIDGKPRKAGDEVSVDEALARRYVREGAAVLVPAEPRKRPARSKARSVAAPAVDLSDQKEK